ncbi:glutamate mutase L [Candidatus Bathyarchaeota archaeon]|nr:glutamate mutase L [Candidatus Bathyarchaeota archaeon]
MGSEEKSYLVVDIDSRSTKAIHVEKTQTGYRLAGIAETPTTLEAPVLNVTEGARAALGKLEKETGKKFMSSGKPLDKYVTLISSSTSGGLHMIVGGVVSRISGESAQRAALGAGALLMDQFTIDDRRAHFEMVAALRSLKPDIMLLAGGTDGGAVSQVLDMAGLIGSADVKPRFGAGYPLPLIYAGNVEIRDRVSKALGEAGFVTRMVENVRPVISKENLGPAREGIYDAYMEHVIVHSPGYKELIKWTDRPVLPTQAAVGKLLYAYAEERSVNLIGVDVGGETTDVYSVYNGVFNRSLDANIGITYGVLNIVKKAGLGNVMRWLSPGTGEREVRNTVGNMMLFDYELHPFQKEVQSAMAKEAIRLGLEKHRVIASRLKGTLVDRTLSDMFNQALEETCVDLLKTHVLVGKGRIFRDQGALESAMILIDSLQPKGVTELLVDRTSIMPHLGNLLGVDREAALQVLVERCLVNLGTCVTPVGKARADEEAVMVKLRTGDGADVVESVKHGEIRVVPLSAGVEAEMTVTPGRGMDVGAGRSKLVTRQVVGGEIGVILDARGRPLERFRVRPVVSNTLHGREMDAELAVD